MIASRNAIFGLLLLSVLTTLLVCFGCGYYYDNSDYYSKFSTLKKGDNCVVIKPWSNGEKNYVKVVIVKKNGTEESSYLPTGTKVTVVDDLEKVIDQDELSARKIIVICNGLEYKIIRYNLLPENK